MSTAHTADAGAVILDAARALLYDAFQGEFSAHDWDHALGGVHALAWEGERLVGHAAVVQRRLLHRGRALRAGYVEGVGVLPAFRRRGHGTALLEAVERVVREAYELGALSTTADGARFYEDRGWTPWRGRTQALTPSGLRATPGDDGGIYVLPVDAGLDPSAELACDWRDGDLW